MLVRVELPSAVPLESLHGRKEDPGRTLRATVQSVLSADDLGEFALGREQGRIRAVFVPIARLQAELEMPGRVNTLLLATRAGPDGGAAAATPILRRVATPSDSGLTVRALPAESTLVVGADAGLIDAARVESATRAATRAGLHAEPVLTYLANSIRTRTARDSVLARHRAGHALVGRARIDSGRIASRSSSTPGPPATSAPASARQSRSTTSSGRTPGGSPRVPRRSRLPVLRRSPRAIANLAPVYPGITDSPSLDDWDPPFPFDLRRVRRVDEDYWNRYRTTPKAFIPLAEGQRLWGSRYGDVTSLRITRRSRLGARPTTPSTTRLLQSRYEAALRAAVDPMATGFAVRDVRAEALAASSGVTDFGQYFVYFSFFLVVSALVLAALFFKLGVEQRVREVGLYDAVGARPAFIRRSVPAGSGGACRASVGSSARPARSGTRRSSSGCSGRDGSTRWGRRRSRCTSRPRRC